MVFIEKSKLINAENPINSGYIAKFYESINKDRQFFLNISDWENFCDYMSVNHIDKLIVLESYLI